MLLFVSPSNPTGAVYPPELVAEIGRWAAEHGLWVITDEIYEHLVYGDARFTSIAVAAPELADRVVVLNGVAKTYAMTGWRVGWMIGPPDVAKAATEPAVAPTSNVCNVAQAAALAAVSGDLSAVARMRDAFDRRRRLMTGMLNEIPGVVCPLPDGAFYCYPSVKGVLGKELAGRRPASTPSWPSWCSTRSTWPWCPARRSAPRATSGCPARWATPTWRRGSPGSASCSHRPADGGPGDVADAGAGRPKPWHAPSTRLPKAHLHLHFTGGMRHSTLVDLAREHRVHLPEALVEEWPPRLRGTDERGWFRFQRLYDIARSVVRTEAEVRRLLHEVAQDERDEGSGWLEIQVDPSGYAGRFGGLTRTVELILDAAAAASAATGVGIGVIIAANRTRHPLDARTLARLAVPHASRGSPGSACPMTSGAGPRPISPRRSGSPPAPGCWRVPHGGELSGPASVRACLDDLHADRIGHGVAAVEDQEFTERIVWRGASRSKYARRPTWRSGSRPRPADVPLRPLLDAGVRVALGADDPLLFGPRLNAQYQIARQVHGLSDGELAELARMSVAGSVAPGDSAARLLGRHRRLAGIARDPIARSPSPEAPSAGIARRTPPESGPRPDPAASPWPVAD